MKICTLPILETRWEITAYLEDGELCYELKSPDGLPLEPVFMAIDNAVKHVMHPFYSVQAQLQETAEIALTVKRFLDARGVKVVRSAILDA